MSSSTGPSTRLKITSIGCGVLLLVLRALFDVRMALLAPSAPFELWYFGSLAACYGIPLAIWFIVGRPELRRPPVFGLDVARSEYVVGVAPRRTLLGLLLLANGTMAPVVQRVPNTDRLRLPTVPGFVPLLATVLGLSIVVWLAMTLLERPRLTLDPDGMTLVNPTGRKRIAWDDIAARSSMLKPRGGGFRIVWRPAAAGRWQVKSIPAYGLHVDPVFLLHAVRVYVDQPERRVEIGTQAGLDRLQRERSSALAAIGFVGAGQ